MYRLVMFTAVVFCAGAFALQPALAQDHYTLEYRFVQGKTYRFADSISIKTSQEVMGQEINLLGVCRDQGCPLRSQE